MKLSELLREVNKDIDDSLDNSDITAWFNRCLDDLAPIIKKEAKTVMDIDSTNAYTIPEDLYELHMVFADDNQYFPIPIQDKDSKGYKIWANEMSFQKGPESGEIKLYYHRKLSSLVNADDVPEIPTPFHDLLIHYAVAYSQYADDEHERQRDAFNRYYQRKQELESYILHNSNTSYTVQIVNPIW